MRFAASELGDDLRDVEVPIFAQRVLHNFDGALICANETIGKRNISPRRKGKCAGEKHFPKENSLIDRNFQISIDAPALKGKSLLTLVFVSFCAEFSLTKKVKTGVKEETKKLEKEHRCFFWVSTFFAAI